MEKNRVALKQLYDLVIKNSNGFEVIKSSNGFETTEMQRKGKNLPVLYNLRKLTVKS